MSKFIAILTGSQPVTENTHPNLLALLAKHGGVQISDTAFCFEHPGTSVEPVRDALCEYLPEGATFLVAQVSRSAAWSVSIPEIDGGLRKLFPPGGPRREVTEPLTAEVNELLRILMNWTVTLAKKAEWAVPAMQEILDGKGELPKDCPSRASAAAMELRQVTQALAEVEAIVDAVNGKLSEKDGPTSWPDGRARY